MSIRVDKALEEHIIKSSRLNDYKNFYSVGAYGYRVGFAYQQHKAINLVWALEGKYGQQVLKDKKIRIIGGGVSGLTVLHALMKLGCENLELYEKNNELIAKPREAEHRLVHPNYNMWPILSGLNVFTSFPFLNWYSAPANVVASRIEDEMDKFMYSESLFPIKKNREVINFSENDNGALLKIKNLEEDHSEEEVNCSIVIFCTGFGAEKADELSKINYWAEQPDLKDVAVKKSAQIFGTGDGAIIDLVSCWAKEPEKYWEIPLRTICIARQRQGVKIEGDRCDQGNGVTAIEQRILSHEQSRSPLSWIIFKDKKAERINLLRKEQKFYIDLVKDMIENRGLKDKLEPLLKEVTQAKFSPVMYGLYKHPFEPTAAPINKILLAYLEITERFKYTPISRPKSDELIESLNTGQAGGGVSQVSFVRIGIGEGCVLLKDCISNDDKKIMTLMGASIIPYIRDNFEDNLQGSLSSNNDLGSGADLQYAKDNIHLVEGFFNLCFGTDAELVKIEETTARIYVTVPKSGVCDEKRKWLEDKLEAVGGIPEKIFGLPVHWKHSVDEVCSV